ncbi:hypothetical protein O3M35_001584 [Rhynocoris fuscipes]|uniref:Uncharacterized protein n=1 Tax=Rhynocoris fuscipes TaxID=488301 RepID=A0AAW1CTZ7_9HEMI
MLAASDFLSNSFRLQIFKIELVIFKKKIFFLLQTPPEAVKKVQKKKEKPITDEDLEKTYTGLDREIAEEFISIAMQPKPPSSRSESSISQIIP